VGDEVQREVEGRDAVDDADREAPSETDVPAAGRERVDVEHLAAGVARGLGGGGERDDGAGDLGLGERHGLARLGDDRVDELVAPALDARGGLGEDGRALERRQPPRHVERRVRRGQRVIQLPLVGRRDVGHPLIGERVNDRRRARRADPLAADKHLAQFGFASHRLILPPRRCPRGYWRGTYTRAEWVSQVLIIQCVVIKQHHARRFENGPRNAQIFFCRSCAFRG
jgi:hypothetical protein